MFADSYSKSQGKMGLTKATNWDAPVQPKEKGGTLVQSFEGRQTRRRRFATDSGAKTGSFEAQ